MWKVGKGFIECTSSQRSLSWFEARKRITASTVEDWLGEGRFQTKEQMVYHLFEPDKLSPKHITTDMLRGIEGEDTVRNYFVDTLCPKGTSVECPSLCIGLTTFNIPWKGKTLYDYYGNQATNPLHPMWYIGASPDGFLTFPDTSQVCLEIKMPRTLSPILLNRTNGIIKNKTIRNLQLPYGHIYNSYLYQMTTCMALTGKDACYYVVSAEDKMYWERIPFHVDLWTNYLFPCLVDVIETEIHPRLDTSVGQNILSQIHEMQQLITPDMCTTVE